MVHRNSLLAIGIIFFVGRGLVSAQKPTIACPTPAVDEARPWLNRKYSPECRAGFVLHSFKTVEEKTKVLEGAKRVGQGDPDVLAALGLSAWDWTDGPAGVNNGIGVTAFPTPIIVGASFDPAVAARYGEMLGQEVFDSGSGSVGGPALDIPRTWHFGRTTESFGEDPYLTASNVVPEIKAIQSKHVVATLKHYAAYTQEQDRMGLRPMGSMLGVNEVVDERALREIYLPAFHSAVAEGGASSIMCSFATINGTPACQSPFLFDILKKEWRFEGNVLPDFPDAQRSILPSFVAGLDWGISEPRTGNTMGALPSFVGQKSLRDGVRDGELSEARLDDMIMRRLLPGFRVGTFDYPPKKANTEISTPAHRMASAEIVAGGAVLLKNKDAVLPFSHRVKTIAVIGAQATDKALVVEQGSPYVVPAHLISAISAINERAGQAVKVFFAQGTSGLDELPALPLGMMKTPSGEPGILTEYFANARLDFTGKPVETQNETSFLLKKSPDLRNLPDNQRYSVRYTTQFAPDKTGVQKFSLALSGTGRLIIDGMMVGKIDRADVQDTLFANIPMTAGKRVEIRVEYTPREVTVPMAYLVNGRYLGFYVSLGWSESDSLLTEAAEAAGKADVAVVFVGAQVGEGMDRGSLSLANDQNALIESVAKANPNTVVVLNVGGAVSMPWLDKVAGVLQMWLPGDADGVATARLLFGDAEPGGRLPITFPRDETQGPGVKQAQYPGTEAADGSLAEVHFDEGMFVGYRYWDQFHQTPLFPFGYGLSYTNFVSKVSSVKSDADGGATLEASVKNTGDRFGSEVVQVYVGFPPGAGEPPKQLKGFRKVGLKPGEESMVRIRLEPHAFECWNDKAHTWHRPEGTFHIMVGRSSRDIFYETNLSEGVIGH